MSHTIYGQPFPMKCPACKEEAGMPFKALKRLDSDGMQVAMRCRECSHEWHVDLPVNAEPKRDSIWRS